MDIFEYLKINGISYRRYDHEAVYTCEQADCLDIPLLRRSSFITQA